MKESIKPKENSQPIVETEQSQKRFKTKKRENISVVEPSKKPVQKESHKIKKEIAEVESVSKLDEVIKRGQDAVARSKETLAQSGQVVTTNPLLTNFL